MTYYKYNLQTELPIQRSVGVMTAPASIVAGQRLPLGSITHTGVTVSGGQITLASGQTYMLFSGFYVEADNASGVLSTLRCQWYNVTDSVYIGRYAETWMRNTDHNGRRDTIVRALIEPASAKTVELRIVSTSGPVSRVNVQSIATYMGTPWYAVASF